jgi:uncharacterized protein YndB with AHSA1/START domain
MIWVYIVLGTAAGLVVLAGVVGSLLPRTHEVARSLRLPQTPEEVWPVISTFTEVPSWWPRLKKVERLPDQNGHEVWRETFGRGEVFTLETVEAVPPCRLVRRIADVNRMFSGRWEFDLEPADGGTKLTLTEYGDIPNPFIRCLGRLCANPATYIEMYLKALAARMGQPAAIECPAGK